MCSVCDSTEDLWICLICGNVGCGRYKGGHAKDHWKGSAHNFALEIVTQHIWDYASGDTGDWVHRLIRNKGDTKIEEMPPRPTNEDQSEDMVSRDKYLAVQSQYIELMNSIGRYGRLLIRLYHGWDLLTITLLDKRTVISRP
jgi:BRCA1-associated protein